MGSSVSISSDAFFAPYYGHHPPLLEQLQLQLRTSRPAPSTSIKHNPLILSSSDTKTHKTELRSIIWLVGDSTLDNKHWVKTHQARGVNGYEDILRPPHVVRDVAHHINVRLASSREVGLAERLGCGAACVNAAVEENRVEQASLRLNDQEHVVQKYLSPQDMLVVSIGGNDLALNPSKDTIEALMQALYAWSPTQVSSRLPVALETIFCDHVSEYIQRLCSLCKPQKIVVCSPYLPRAAKKGFKTEEYSWANSALAAFGYNTPEGVRAFSQLLRCVHETMVHKVCGPEGVPLTVLALQDVMDSRSTSSDFVARIEPSVDGGAKMANAIVDALLRP